MNDPKGLAAIQLFLFFLITFLSNVSVEFDNKRI